MKNNIPVIDLFAGPGGLGEGFSCAGFDITLSIEMDPIACKTLRLRKFFNLYKNISVVLYKSKSLCIVKVKKLPDGDFAFLSNNQFYERVGNSTRQREGDDLAYIMKNKFNKKNN